MPTAACPALLLTQQPWKEPESIARSWEEWRPSTVHQ